jgi:hypothetical protein
MNNNDQSMEEMMESVNRIFEATQAVIETMSNGDRIQLKDLAQTVGLAVASDPKHVLGFVHHYVHNSNFAYVSRGKNGGVIKGKKPTKIV